LELLPERAREIFELSRFEGLKYQEIAEKLDISIKTVEANMSKTLKLFRDNLKDYLGIFIVLIDLILIMKLLL
jgi:RNA polymerase sigma-70 factor (ECF subfamily)